MTELLKISTQLETLHNLMNEIRLISINKQKPFLNIDETSDYLGISKATIYGYTHRCIIPFFKLQDRRLYFDINDLNNFILNKKNRSKSNPEIEAESATDFITKKS